MAPGVAPEALRNLTIPVSPDDRQQNPSPEPGAAVVATLPIYLLVYGLQRYRMLRRQEDDFSFSAADKDQPPAPDKQFAELLRERPPLGVHVLAWSDTLATLDRTLDRQSISEFDNRVLFQMGATDSSNLIDTPDANKLGFYRALLYSEERGLLEKFRPYAAFDSSWLEHARHCFGRKAASPDSGECVG